MKNRLFSFSYTRIFSLLLIILMPLAIIGTVPAYATNAPVLTCEAAILIDGKTGSTLFEKNSSKVMFPASTTKIMTAMVVLEAIKNGEITLDTQLTLSQGAFDSLATDGSSIWLEVGESMSVDGLLKGLLIASGNDAAAVLAEGIAGTQEAFVTRMNEKATAMGLSNTHFVNPHGLHHEQHYTTAFDMAKLTFEAMKDETFRSIVECAHIKLPATNMSEERYFINTNNLVSKMRYAHYYYEYATGIKTGSTTEAGSCLVSSAQKKDSSVIAVVFNASDTSVSHNESKALLEYGLTAFSLQRLAKRDDIFGEIKVKQAADGTDHIILSAENNVDALFPKNGDTSQVEVVTNIPENVRAPIAYGQVIGTATFMYKGNPIGKVNLVSTVKIERHFLGEVMSFFEWVWSFTAVKVIVYILLAVVLFFVSVIVVGFTRALKKSKRKHRRMSDYHPPKY